ncbi:mitochondrial protein [Phytophthora cinnamomi]|uniref:mitochondrial protein n=1 Tax=Phytophthora cinnamomi TaxID=4785 RepID=UPI00355A8915|nr:mitochondrial protein [Phytophthora cinnamomi]
MGELEVETMMPTTAAPAPSRAVRGWLEPLLRPTELREGFQVSVHACPRLMLRELKHVFPAQFQRAKGGDAAVLAVLTCQKSLMDLSQYGVDADKEKDRLLETFVAFAQQVANALIARKYWADFIDPCSGLPMLTLSSNKVYSEVDGVELLLRYRCLSAGMCKILVHPVWGAAVYPASLFTTAPYEVVKEVLHSLPDEAWNVGS